MRIFVETTISNPAPDKTPMADDILREVWGIKDELATRCDHDLDRLFAETRDRQLKSGRPSVNLQQKNRKQAA